MKRFVLVQVIFGSYLVCLVAFAPALYAEGAELSLQRTLELAEKQSPGLKASTAREEEAGESASIAASGFYPTLEVAAVDSSGFPGSAPGLDGFSGLVASPYRKGPAADAFAKWDVVDLSVWHGLAASNFEIDASRENTRFQRTLVDSQALRVYLEAVLYRGNREAWLKLIGDLEGVRDTVKRYVRNGQYSEVQHLLIEDQLDDANLKQQEYDRKYRTALVRLAMLTGLDPSNISCPAPMDLSENAVTALNSGSASPLVAKAEDEMKAARETEKKFFSQNFPKIEAGASAGYLSDERLVPEQDYSLFVGATLPIFEGFKTSAEEKRAGHEEEARASEEEQAKLELDDLNARYDDEIEGARSDLQTLLPEQERSAQAVALAKSRYLSFLGPLSDLQQSLKDMVNSDNQIAQVKTQLILALNLKAFVNGATIGSEQ